MKEIKILQSLYHENIVKIFSHGNVESGPHKVKLRHETVSYIIMNQFHQGRYAIVMEYCNGRSLDKLLSEEDTRNGLKDDDFMSLLECLCETDI